MNLKRACLVAVIAFTIADAARAGLLHMEFAGGSSEVTMRPGDTVQIDLLWTMQPTDTVKSRMTGVDLRLNVNDVPDPDGTSAPGKFIVESASSPIPEWYTYATGIGEPFSRTNFFLGVGHADGVIGPIGDGTEFTTHIASIVLQKVDFVAGDTYITFWLGVSAGAVYFPAVFDGPADWSLQWQTEVTGPRQFDLGLGNPGDAGPQWDPYHGYETFQPLIIHNVPEPEVGIVFLGGLAALSRRRR